MIYRGICTRTLFAAFMGELSKGGLEMAESISQTVFPLISVNIGSVQTGVYKGKEATSSIGKSKVDRTVFLTLLGLSGDEQADLVNHGGPDKAICVYSFDHYPHWENVLHRSLSFGAFGENFTVQHLNEGDVHIGDIFHIGTAVVQISQPRIPCWKLAMKWGLDELPLLVTESGFSGFYFRVLLAGEVKAGDELLLKETHPARVTVAEANRLMHKDKEDVEAIRRFITVDTLSTSWVDMLTSRLKRLEGE
jgi:MOSC domain-containing protein YiiM